MMGIRFGTRQGLQTSFNSHPSSRSNNVGLTRDVGMSKNVTASITFVNGGTNQLQAANGTFTPFAIGDQIRVDGANLNNGNYTVLAIDATNHAFLIVDNGLKNEGPISCTVRTE
jgi:hypothetical protein